ncbi:hypothetical protein MtrunA17_Chr7g0232911 [Medicago truncatula]|uniref:Transmembrane protein n=1 Tax=Medicago truncatula TaxID=3880 RepID=A0A396GWV9_MEDTR|nr:hypothetical protein MtrunA17_Chr7g0232911 [Medicago truncatula]
MMTLVLDCESGWIDRRRRILAAGGVVFFGSGSIQLQPFMAVLLFNDRSHLCSRSEPLN